MSLFQAVMGHEIISRNQYRDEREESLVNSVSPLHRSSESEHWHFSHWSSVDEFTLHYCQCAGWVGGLSCSWTIPEMSEKMFQWGPRMENRITLTLSFSRYQEETKAIWTTKDEFIFSSGPFTKAALSSSPTEEMMNMGTWCPWLSFALSSSFPVWHRLTFTTFHFCGWKTAIDRKVTELKLSLIWLHLLWLCLCYLLILDVNGNAKLMMLLC